MAHVSRQAIVGGTPSPDDTGVYLLMIQGSNGATSTCSATLIAPRTLLTAAHCVDPVILGASSVSITATNVADRAQLEDGGVPTVRVVETRFHPSWTPAIGLSADLGLALLETAQTTPPVPWSTASISMLGGEPVRALGYGSTGNDQGFGVRRSVELIVRQLSPQLITLGNEVDKGICHGDSGGPTLYRFADGVERIIGVHSFTRTAACVDGADTRLDALAPFIMEWIAAHEDACGPNGVCSTTTCAQPDVDCLPTGNACTWSWQCPGRNCVADPQHPEPYCTSACGSDADCGPLMRCDLVRAVCQRPQLPTSRLSEACRPNATFCLNNGVCGGLSADAPRCSRPCATPSDCASPMLCKTGFTGQNVCVDPPPVLLPIARLEVPAAPGCSTGTGLLTPLLLLLACRRRTQPTARRGRNC